MTQLPFRHRFIVFDLDGTLVDSQHTIVHCMGRAFSSDGLPAPTAQAVRGIIGLKLEVAIGTLLPEPDEERALKLAGRYREAFHERLGQPDHDEPLFEGTLECLSALDHPELFLGIVTGKNRRGLERVLAHHEIQHRFTTLRTADDGPSKPHPHVLQLAMADVGADPQDTVMIGDTTFDIQMARSAGCDAVGVDWGYHHRDELKAAGAGKVVDRFSDLRQALIDLSGV
ncbi:HAD-IA family hydrolase [Pelagibius sp.]|uniref:HAD-IA family hydrolase n=1 Tax=Pelagibius sp. TaxID=1931238 RepID=UPI003BB18A13